MYETWVAHRQLAETIHAKLDALLKSQHRAFGDIGGVICFKGPGSFTGLRIGLSVANSLAYSFSIPIVGVEGESWIQIGFKKLLEGKDEKTAMPEYGGAVHTTLPSK